MKKIIHFTTLLWVVILFSILSIGCAKQGFPSGGPKDVTPPVAGEAMPPTATTNFSAKEFYIPFDEYVIVKDAENNILISPPLKKKPEYIPKGRGLLIKIKDTLQANTTYLFQFKGAIADLNEGNALDSYEYAFSTGDILDSMTLSGSVLDGITLKPREETVTVMLYNPDKDDSVVVKETPQYITRCNKDGLFEFNNIAPGSYRILAIEDGDRNMKMGEDEAMAFSDTLVVAKIKPKTVPNDTTVKDTIQTAIPTLPKPSIKTPINGINLLMTNHENEIQRIIKERFLHQGKIQIVTFCPMIDCDIKVLECDTCKPEPIEWRINKGNDTITIWTLRETCDSIALVVRDGDRMQDTLKIKMRKNTSRKGKPHMQQPKTPLIHTITRNTVEFFDTIWFGFDNPIDSITNADSAVAVMNLKDSNIVHCGLRLTDDKLRGWVDMKLEQGEKYKLTILDNMVTDIYGHHNDTIHLETEVSQANQYGNLYLSIGNDELKFETSQIILELLNEENKVIRTHISNKAETVEFKNLKPNKYKVRAIMDRNGNEKWDSGDYWKKIQPEKVTYFSKTLDLRANWDMEERW